MRNSEHARGSEPQRVCGKRRRNPLFKRKKSIALKYSPAHAAALAFFNIVVGDSSLSPRVDEASEADKSED
jgi:hypothetical protein